MTNDVFSQRSEQKLNALSQAVKAITAELDLDTVLSRIAEIAAQLINARYAALGVPDGRGGMAKFMTYGMSEEEISKMDHFPLGRGLLGLLLTRSEPLRLEDFRTDERSVGLPPNHPKMTSLLGVPIQSKGRILGSLYLCDRLDNVPFTEDDENMVKTLAGHAAVAIENALLYSQLRKLTVIEERDRISMELHDGIIQQIYAIGIKLELTRMQLTDFPDIQRTLSSSVQDLNEVIEDLRNYIRDLRVGVDYNVSLHEQLEEITQAFSQVSKARLIMDVAKGFAQLSEMRLHAIIQILREALSNVARHAQATEVYVDLHETTAHISLVISDNGQGFDPQNIVQGNGLHNVKQRARLLGGMVDIISQPGRGVTMTVKLPIQSIDFT